MTYGCSFSCLHHSKCEQNTFTPSLSPFQNHIRTLCFQSWCHLCSFNDPTHASKILSAYGLAMQIITSTYVFNSLRCLFENNLQSTWVMQWIQKWKCPLFIPRAIHLWTYLILTAIQRSVCHSVYKEQDSKLESSSLFLIQLYPNKDKMSPKAELTRDSFRLDVSTYSFSVILLHWILLWMYYLQVVRIELLVLFRYINLDFW